MFDLVFSATASYALALSPLGAMILAGLYKLYQAIMSQPIVASVVNTTLVALESTKEVWMPVASVALAVIKQVGAALVVIVKYARHLVLFAQSTVKGLVLWFRDNGVDVGVAAQNFGHSMLVIGKAFGRVLFYVAQGLSSLISSFEETSAFLSQAYKNPESITWELFTANAYSLAVSLTMVSLLTWWLLKPARPQKAILIEPQMKPPRMETRASRRRAMLTCDS